MNFTKSNTIREIFANMENQENVKNFFSMLFFKELLDFVPQEAMDQPLSKIEKTITMPWGMPFPTDELLEAADLAEKQVKEPIYDIISLWKKTEPGNIPKLYPSTEEGACLFTEKPFKGKNKPAVIICPGGGYENLSVNGEGFKMAQVLKKAGYHPFVLTYRLKPNYYPKPHIDLAYAIKYVRKNAEAYGIDSENLMIMGASAGGHLCASFGLVYDEIDKVLLQTLEEKDPALREEYKNIPTKPNKIALTYPVISLVKECHTGSALGLTGGNPDLCKKLSVDLHVTPDYPKTFLWACEDDDLVPVSNTLRMGAALEANGVDYKMEVFPSGGHGCGLAYHTSAKSWMEDLICFMK